MIAGTDPLKVHDPTSGSRLLDTEASGAGSGGPGGPEPEPPHADTPQRSTTSTRVLRFIEPRPSATTTPESVSARFPRNAGHHPSRARAKLCHPTTRFGAIRPGISLRRLCASSVGIRSLTPTCRRRRRSTSRSTRISSRTRMPSIRIRVPPHHGLALKDCGVISKSRGARERHAKAWKTRPWWFRRRDSNPDKRIQNPLSCH